MNAAVMMKNTAGNVQKPAGNVPRSAAKWLPEKTLIHRNLLAVRLGLPPDTFRMDCLEQAEYEFFLQPGIPPIF